MSDIDRAEKEQLALYSASQWRLMWRKLRRHKLALLGGTVVIESVFSWPGIGRTILEGITSQDFPVVQGGVLIVSFSFIFMNLIVDILYKWLDPRIKLE